MKFEVYGKPGCAACKSTRDKLRHLLTRSGGNGGTEIVFVDMDSVTGRAEGAFYDVREVPTTIVRADGGGEVTRFTGIVPPSGAVKDLLAAPPA